MHTNPDTKKMRLCLIGNPNVGKSLIFSQLTGIGVEISNFPGTTVEIFSGKINYDSMQVEISDFPGIYSLDGTTDAENEARVFLQDKNADRLVIILDAAHLERNLYLLLQIAEYDIPSVVIINQTDEADKNGIAINFDKLAEILVCPVIPTIATEGYNIDKIIPSACNDAAVIGHKVPYDKEIEAAVRIVSKNQGTDSLTTLLALEGIQTKESKQSADANFSDNDNDLEEITAALRDEIEDSRRMSLHQIVAANRHNEAKRICEEIISSTVKRGRISGKFDSLLTRVSTGVPIMIAVLLATLLSVFIIGSFLEETIVELFNTFIIAPMYALNLPPFPQHILYSILIAIEAGLGIAFPFVFVFYILISLLEDTGYMTRAAFLADRAMHNVGMHGQALIPMVLGFGCNVPAIMSTRQLPKREKIIASFLITMVPCSARTVIIAGIVFAFVGLFAALSIYLIVFVLIILTGILLTKITPGEQLGMIIEIVPLRKPILKLTLTRAWLRMKEFIFIAMPLLIVSSVVLGVLQYVGAIQLFQDMVAGFMFTALGLPDYASTSLLFGILRKEMAFETLAILGGTTDLASIMTSAQLYIFAVVSTLFVPCISTIAVLYREMGGKIAALVSFYTLILGLIAGVVLNFIFHLI